MKFSIIIPVYKTEKYLRQCVDSVLCQSFTDFELVLVDNESPDTCPAICEEYASQDNRVRVIHKKHGTAASARNVGMKSALGDYLCFLDSDDYWIDGEVLSKINNKLEQSNPDIVELFYQGYVMSTGKYVLTPDIDYTDFYKADNEDKIKFLIVNDRLNPSAWGMCISRKFLEKSQAYFDDSKIIEDIDWCVRLFSANPKVDAIQERVYVYRIGRPGSVATTMKVQSLFDLCEIINNAPSILDVESGKSHILMNYVCYQVMITLALTYRKSVQATTKQKKEIRKSLKEFCKKYLKYYHVHPKVSKAYKIYRIFGYKVMSFALGFYLNHRSR
ncbi:MAG: glycosyltransferase family 2 protein [Clostridia bacterium]|nr:glycosyltransferase family 2 protein [Clostridia bacterium]